MRAAPGRDGGRSTVARVRVPRLACRPSPTRRGPRPARADDRWSPGGCTTRLENAACRSPSPWSSPPRAPAADEPAADEPAAEEPIEQIVVVGQRAEDVLRRSAAAVTVVDLDRAQSETADLGEILARTGGVGARRAGGLGAATRLSLDGFGDDRVRLLVDGLPLALSGLGAETRSTAASCRCASAPTPSAVP